MITNFYKSYLRSKKWALKRQEVFAYHGKRCKACRTGKGPLQVHHLDYTRIGNESAIHDLVPLCIPCHKEVTRRYRRNRRRGLRAVTMEYVVEKRRARPTR